MTKKKICVFTGARSDYGLLHCLMSDIQQDSNFLLQVLVGGMHPSPLYGNTYQEIERDGFQIDRMVDHLVPDNSPMGVASSMGLGTIAYAQALTELKPDLLVILGDRFEALAVAVAAQPLQIPIAHLHGGEVTMGAVDDNFRHAISKMSHLHFVAAKPYRERLISMGELPNRIFVVGAMGLDNLRRVDFMSKNQLSKELNFQFGQINLMVTFHPETIGKTKSLEQVKILLKALEAFPDAHVILTMPNADPGSENIIKLLSKFVTKRNNCLYTASLGYRRYLSCLRHVDVVVGNSSSGIIEAPALGVPTVNIGNRQAGRLQASSIQDCFIREDAIIKAISRAIKLSKKGTIKPIVLPYGKPGASQKIIRVLKKLEFPDLLKKYC